MQPPCTASHALLPVGATALEIPLYRPLSVQSFKLPGILPPASAVRLVPSPSERRATGPGSATVYVTMSSPCPDMDLQTRHTAFGYITPHTSPCRAEPEAFLRRVFRTLAPDLARSFEILDDPLFGSDVGLGFHTHAQREAAVRRQPFRLDGATLELAPLRTINLCHAADCFMVHVALHKYPNEERTVKDIKINCSGFGALLEIGVAECDRSTVCVVLQIDQPRKIPYELHIEYTNGFTCVVPVHILSVWKCSESFDANGDYVFMF